MNLRMTRRHILNWAFVISWLMSNWIVYFKYGANTTLVMDVVWMLVLLGLVIINVQDNWKVWMDKDVMSKLGGMIETNQDVVANFFAFGWFATNLGFYLMYGIDALIFSNLFWLVLGALMVLARRKSDKFYNWLKQSVYVEKE